ncbi:hypothetical protein TTHERM_000365419 (macronuclear) [Tetrahymena thermophila SB210]|uniref:Uncharacterized protein n=1 Tax=Tetrahymena thermophila (strain SB210) TaxID=312017 RepID=W7XB05_TETTS|nr:hypothetical protein TTHERM_000365419 [Tetrahymena thermophila SB210]EWS76555.1 hypothetical protein TTHERM_000365419 [Tetrahymena thermophila SB210]|eukprot:XP_012650927.1 hypothetical protein TTHERM_000365419 [Tetrahymena thermophila SB210]
MWRAHIFEIQKFESCAHVRIHQKPYSNANAHIFNKQQNRFYILYNQNKSLSKQSYHHLINNLLQYKGQRVNINKKQNYQSKIKSLSYNRQTLTQKKKQNTYRKPAKLNKNKKKSQRRNNCLIRQQQ